MSTRNADKKIKKKGNTNGLFPFPSFPVAGEKASNSNEQDEISIGEIEMKFGLN